MVVAAQPVVAEEDGEVESRGVKRLALELGLPDPVVDGGWIAIRKYLRGRMYRSVMLCPGLSVVFLFDISSTPLERLN